MPRLPSYFLSHGGGPWPWMEDARRTQYAALEASIAGIPTALGGLPKTVLMVTSHWETQTGFAVSAAAAPGMIYDYSGFPPHTYGIRYAAPGDPALAAEVAALLRGAGLGCTEDPARGFDHGTFTVMQVLRPQADIPVVQLSIRADYDVAAHIAAGRALAALREAGVLIIGSGLSYHNLRLWGEGARAPSHAFDAWLQQALIGTPAAAREQNLLHWQDAPAARQAHPREDHLIPLMVAAGAAGEDLAQSCYHEDEFFGAVAVSSFRFG